MGRLGYRGHQAITPTQTTVADGIPGRQVLVAGRHLGIEEGELHASRQDAFLRAFEEAIHAHQIALPCSLLDVSFWHLCLWMVEAAERCSLGGSQHAHILGLAVTRCRTGIECRWHAHPAARLQDDYEMGPPHDPIPPARREHLDAPTASIFHAALHHYSH